MNSNEKPARAMPRWRTRPEPNRRIRTPARINGRTRVFSFSLKPTMATSQPVTVVPTLAPKMTPRAWGKVSSPAPTKLTAVTVVALDD